MDLILITRHRVESETVSRERLALLLSPVKKEPLVPWCKLISISRISCLPTSAELLFHRYRYTDRCLPTSTRLHDYPRSISDMSPSVDTAVSFRLSSLSPRRYCCCLTSRYYFPFSRHCCPFSRSCCLHL